MNQETETNITTDGDEENSVIKSLRAAEAAAKADAKRALAELEELRGERAQSRQAKLEAAVNGRNYPDSVVEMMKGQVETATNEQFEALLQDLAPSGDDDQGVPDEGDDDKGGETAPSTPNPADLGQRVAAAATGAAGEVDVIKKLATAETRADLLASVAEHGLDKF